MACCAEGDVACVRTQECVCPVCRATFPKVRPTPGCARGRRDCSRFPSLHYMSLATALSLSPHFFPLPFPLCTPLSFSAQPCCSIHSPSSLACSSICFSVIWNRTHVEIFLATARGTLPPHPTQPRHRPGSSQSLAVHPPDPFRNRCRGSYGDWMWMEENRCSSD